MVLPPSDLSFQLPPGTKRVLQHEFRSVLYGPLLPHKMACFAEQVEANVLRVRDGDIRMQVGNRGPFRWLRNSNDFPVQIDISAVPETTDSSIFHVRATLTPQALFVNRSQRHSRYERLIRELHACLMVHQDVIHAA